MAPELFCRPPSFSLPLLLDSYHSFPSFLRMISAFITTKVRFNTASRKSKRMRVVGIASQHCHSAALLSLFLALEFLLTCTSSSSWCLALAHGSNYVFD